MIVSFIQTGCTTFFTEPTPETPKTIKHSIFVTGHGFTGVIDEDGKEEWKISSRGYRDGYILDNGHALLCESRVVREIDRKNKEHFRYTLSKENKELSTAVRLENGNTMITELGAKPRLIEVNKKGKVVIDIPLQPGKGSIHHQTRMARKLKSGNYLVPHLSACAVKEYDPTGNVVNVFKTDFPEIGLKGGPGNPMPFTAIRLANGNTHINCTQSNKVIEVDSKGKLVWWAGNKHFPKVKPFRDPCGAQRMSYGTTVVTSYGNRKGMIFEITKDHKIIWQLKRHAHHFQILTTNGVKVKNPQK